MVAAALETNDPANAVVLVASSWPLAGLWLPLDVNSRSSHFNAVEPVMLQFTATHTFTAHKTILCPSLSLGKIQIYIKQHILTTTQHNQRLMANVQVNLR